MEKSNSANQWLVTGHLETRKVSEVTTNNRGNLLVPVDPGSYPSPASPEIGAAALWQLASDLLPLVVSGTLVHARVGQDTICEVRG